MDYGISINGENTCGPAVTIELDEPPFGEGNIKRTRLSIAWLAPPGEVLLMRLSPDASMQLPLTVSIFEWLAITLSPHPITLHRDHHSFHIGTASVNGRS